MTVVPASAVPVNVGVVLVAALVVAGLEGAAGEVLSTVNVVPGPAAGALLPAVSVAVPAAIEIPMVPSPARLERVTVRPLPEPVTPTDAVSVPVVFNVMFLAARVLELKLTVSA